MPPVAHAARFTPSGCSEDKVEQGVDPPDPADALVRRFLDGVATYQPVDATELGDHRRDDALPDLAPEEIDAWTRTLSCLRDDVDRQLQRLDAVRPAVSCDARGDLVLLRQRIDAYLFGLRERPRLELDPLAALDLASGGVHELLRRLDVPWSRQRTLAEAAVLRARRVPYLLEQAGRLLTGSPRPHLAVALQRIDAVVALMRQDLPARVRALGGDETAARDAGDVAVEGLVAYGALLSELQELPAAPWRVGAERHALLLRTTVGTSLDPDELVRRAEDQLARVTSRLADLAARMDDGQGRRASGRRDTIQTVLGRVATRCAVPPGELLAEARRAVDDARRFTLAAGLVDVPPSSRLTVAEAPPYVHGLAVAFLQAAPPLEPDAGSTYYLSPVPQDWDHDRQQLFRREYHRAALRLVALHEGYPGHFVQLEHAARHPRLARRVLRSPAFAEGWAIHLEREAIRQGFADALPVARDDLLVTYDKLQLSVAANVLLDVGLHRGDLGDEEALALLVERTFVSRREAESKLVQGKITAGQLSSYFAGGVELADLCAAEERSAGPAFDPAAFHQRLLSFGTPSLPVLRDALADPSAAPSRPFAASGRP